MELSLRMIVIMILLLVAALVLVSLALNWGNMANTIFSDFIRPIQNWVLGR